MRKVKDGKIVGKAVDVKVDSSIEHGNINNVTSIVLHRTDSSNAGSAFQAYTNGKKSGGYFLIDKAWKIDQTADMKKRCWHVRTLLPGCQIEKNCDPKELKTIMALTHEKGFSFSRRAGNLSRHEAEKKYPLRYPSNNDSIGIEVVGKFWAFQKSFVKLTQQQFKSLKWSVEIIAKKYNLNIKTNVYAHGAIARKEASEDARLLQHLFSGMAA